MSRRYLRPEALAGHVLVLIAVLVCLRLGWWQWNVAHETRGTIQNIGYALLWPVFGGAFIFMWLRFLYLEDERRAQQTDGGDAPEALDASGLDASEPEETAVARRADDEFGATSGDGPALDSRLDRAGAAGVGSIDESPTAPTGPTAEALVEGHRADLGPAAGPDAGGAADETDPPDPAPVEPKRARRTRMPSTAVTIATAFVGGDDDDDPELAAYNAALARLAEQDNRRAR